MCIGLAMSAMWQKTTIHREATVAWPLTNHAALICWSTTEKCLLCKNNWILVTILELVSWHILKYVQCQVINKAGCDVNRCPTLLFTWKKVSSNAKLLVTFLCSVINDTASCVLFSQSHPCYWHELGTTTMVTKQVINRISSDAKLFNRDKDCLLCFKS